MVTGEEISVAGKSHAEVGRDVTVMSDYYLPAGADPGQLICTVVLTGPNYERWAKYMRNALKAKNKLGFIDGLVTKPSCGEEEIKLWGVVNSMLVAWILNTVEPKLRSSVSTCADTAFELWDGLRTRFSLGNEARVYELKTNVATFKQDAYSVEDYFGWLRLLWDDLDDFEPVPVCCCGQSSCASIEKQIEIRDKEHKYQFLMGLDGARFGTIRSNILCMTPPPSLDSAFSMVLQEERRQQGTGVSDPVAQSGPPDRGSNVSFTCTYCGRIGHEEKTCYRLRGFPSRGRGRGRGSNSGRGGGGRASAVQANFDGTSTSQESEVSELQSSIPVTNQNYNGSRAQPKKPSEIIENNADWLYEDPHGYIQGPFPLAQLKAWNEAKYFDKNFKVWMDGQSLGSAVLLTDVLLRVFG